ncbi:MAG: NADH-quinone oxidoreductase subunit NuoN [Betaproteobacteria bacterium]|nr:NADH-quinone oxidoreductase subunit NuoN [Betaproteobacteria bacterium]
MQYIQPLWPAYAELFLLGMACLILIVDLFLRDENRGVTYLLTQFTLAGCAVITWAYSSGEPDHTFSGMFVGDLMADVLKLITYFGVMATLVYARDYISLRGMFRGEFFTLTLFATLGLMVMISANHLLTLYLGLELLSLSLYAMVSLQRDSTRATEAAMKYFVLGALASGMLLYGMSMIYGATGTLETTRIFSTISDDGARNVVLVFGLVFVVAGIGFKLGAAPFHMWLPDVYHGAPTAVTLFIGSVPKLAAFAFVIRILVQALGVDEIQGHWQQMLAVMAVLSLIVGNITAIAQTNIKRMLAYSTISHMGFLLIGILAGGLNGYASGMFYVVAYVLMSLGAFGMIMLLSRQGFEAENLDDFKGLNQRSPWHAFLMLLLMFSMAGVPPTVGFYAKFAVLQAVVEAGHVWLAVIAVIFSLVGAFYYLRVVKLMYFDDATDTALITPRGDAQVLLSVNGLAVLAFGIFPQPLMALCGSAILASL